MTRMFGLFCSALSWRAVTNIHRQIIQGTRGFFIAVPLKSLRVDCGLSVTVVFSYIVKEIQLPLSSSWSFVTILQPLGLNTFSEFAISAVFWPKSFSYMIPLSSMTKVITPELRYSAG